MLNFFYRCLNNKKGFTLIEVLVVVAIIAILAAIATPIILGRIQQAREAADEALKNTLGNTLGLYLLDVDAGVYEPGEGEINAAGFPVDLDSILQTDWLDSATLESITTIDATTVEGRTFNIDYDPTNGVFELVEKP